MYTHPVVTTIRSTTNKPTIAPVASIGVGVHVSEAGECVGDGYIFVYVWMSTVVCTVSSIGGHVFG